MFTGIITDIGTLINKNYIKDKDFRFRIKVKWVTKNIILGSSICCNGVCLTVVKTGFNWFEVDVSEESLSRTNFLNIDLKDKINLEKSLKIGDELGGHSVTGHIDDTAKLIDINPVKSSFELKFRVQEEIIRYITSKGSIALNGISLTINKVKDSDFSVNIISHTWNNTNISYLKLNDNVNLEIDIISRYVNRYLDNMKIK